MKNQPFMMGPTSARVRNLVGISWWPHGLKWFGEIGQNSLSRRKELQWHYSIPSKGRTGAAARQKLMACGRRFHVVERTL